MGTNKLHRKFYIQLTNFSYERQEVKRTLFAHINKAIHWAHNGPGQKAMTWAITNQSK